MITRFKGLKGALLTMGVLAVAAPAAQARFVSVDFGSDSGFALNGQLFTVPLSSTNGAVPFQLDFGQGLNSYDYCYSGTGGFVQFVSSGGACNAGAVPSGNYISPFLVAMSSNSATVTSGVVDTIHSGGADPYVKSDATTAAIRFIWNGEDSAHNQFISELLLLDRGSGSFDAQFMYGSDVFGLQDTPNTGQQVIHLGTNLHGPIPGPLFSATDYSFSFTGGTCPTCVAGTDGGGGTVNVTEPPTLLMWALALCGVLLIQRRRSAGRLLLTQRAV